MPLRGPSPRESIGWRVVILLVGALVPAAGCASAGGEPALVPVSPGAVRPDPTDSVVFAEPGDPLAPPVVDARHDPLLASSLLRDETFSAAVEGWTARWTSASAPWFEQNLTRMAAYVPEIDSMILEKDLPRSLRYLPVIESGYDPTAVSSARAVGLWQLMPGTARGLGVEVSPLLDERRHPVRSTEAALDFLAALREDFGSWALALAAYNSGPGRVRRILNRYAPLEIPSDALFWRLRDHFPRETRDFVPKFFAAIRVTSAPAFYGHRRPHSERVRYDEVTIPDATTLDVVARAAGVPQAEVEALNPHVVRGITPPNAEVKLRVPVGTGERFRRSYSEIPREERVTFVEHRVAEGETLSHIAVRYGVRVDDLSAANPGVRPRYLKVGTTLVVPVAPSARRGA